MTAASWFSEVLDEKLQAWPRQVGENPATGNPVVGAVDTGFRCAVGLTLPFAAPIGLRASHAYGGPGVVGGAASSGPPPRPPRSPRVRRRLQVSTPGQRDALARLKRLGADLGTDLADDDLKRAFRVLARRLHPDGHPGLPRADRQRLEALFAEAADAYRTLLAPSQHPAA